MAQQTMHIDNFFSTLEHFWNTDKYTDVTIECGNKNFKCHRLVLAATCEYFDAMFGGQFRERNSDIIPLPKISAQTFEQVLKFMYTGGTSINSENVSDLLEASEFFQLPGMEDLCIQFVKENGVTVQDTLDIFKYACATKKQILVDILGLRIANHFEVFSKANSFLEISFDDLKTILSRCTSSSVRNEEALLSAITRWIHHNREERLQYFSEFVKMIRFENISSTYVQFMFTKFFLNTHNTVLTQTLKPIGYTDDFLLQESSISGTKTSLHVFVTHAEDGLVRVYSINGSPGCSVSSWNPQFHPHQMIRNVALNNSYLYSLQYPLKSKNLICQQRFCAYSSVSIPSELRLKSPPMNFSSIYTNLCAIENNIYACYPSEPDIGNQTNSSTLFSEEEINRGICVYNCEVDDWFPVPEMKRQMKIACMTAHNNVLYIVGGVGLSSNIVDLRGYAQMYDRRAGIWQELSKTPSRHAFTGCCSMKDKIYVCCGLNNNKIGRYDPVAGKWDEWAAISPLQRPMVFNRLVPFLDKLWFMGSISLTGGQFAPYNLSIDVLDVGSNRWTKSSILSGTILDAVVFKSN